MSTAEDFLLLVTDPDSGRPKLGGLDDGAVLGGAILFDLVSADRLDLDDAGRKSRVVVKDQAALEDPVLEEAFARVRSRGRQSPQTTVTRLGKRARKNIYAALTEQGAVTPRGDSVLGIKVSTYDVADVARRDDLLMRVRGVLLLDQEPDEQTGPLIGLLAAADLTKHVVDKPDRKRARARAKVVADGDWASEGVRKAVQAAQAAVTTAIIAGGAAAASSS